MGWCEKEGNAEMMKVTVQFGDEAYLSDFTPNGQGCYNGSNILAVMDFRL